MFVTPDLVKAYQHDLLEAGERARRNGRPFRTSTISPLASLANLPAAARAAALRLRRDPEIVPGPFAACPTC